MTPKKVINGGDPQLEKAVEMILDELEDQKSRRLPNRIPLCGPNKIIAAQEIPA